VLDRVAPDTVPTQPKRGVKRSSPHRLFRLLACSCGTVMTPATNRHGNPYYRCSHADVDPSHVGRYRILESKLMPALKAEAAHLRLPETVTTEGADEAERAKLAAKRARIVDLYADGLIDKAKRSRRIDAVQDAEAALARERVTRSLPEAIDWDWAPELLNGVLRALWARVELGPDMTPVRFEWNVPEWRAE
jgi:hypothetical protein